MHCQHRSSVQCLISFSHLFSHPAFLLHFRHFSCFEFLQFFPPRHGTSRGCVLFFLISTDLLTSLDILWYYLPNCFPKWSVFCLVLSVCACVCFTFIRAVSITLVPSRLIPDISKHFPHNMFPNTESPTCFAFPSFSPVAGQTFVAFERESRSRRSDSSWDRNSDGEWRRRKVYLLNARCFAVLLWRLGEHNKSWAQCDSATMRHCDTATSEESWGHQGYDLQWAMYNLLAYCCGKVLAVLYIRKYPYCHTNTILQYRSKFSTCYAKAVLLNSPWWEPNFVARSGFGQGHRCHSSSGSFPFPEPEEVIKSHKYVNRLWFNDGIK